MLIEDDRWKRKGGAHKPRQSDPEVCPECGGLGYIKAFFIGEPPTCNRCNGDGEIWE